MALVQYDLYLYTRGLGYTDGVEGKRDEEMQGEDGHLQGKERPGTDLPLQPPEGPNSDNTHHGFHFQP